MATDDPTLIPDWVQKGVLAIIATLTSIIAYFYRQLETQNRQSITDLKADSMAYKSKIDLMDKERLDLYRLQGELKATVTLLQEEIKDLRNGSSH